MAPRSGDLVRPLLFVGKDDILTYLTEWGQASRLDSTNALTDASRNRLRQAGMAALTAINPRAAAHIAACAEKLRAEDEFLNRLAQDALQKAQGSRAALAGLPPVLRERAAMLLLRQVTDDFTAADVDRLTDLFSLPSGRTAPLRGHLVARADGDRLTIGPAAAEESFRATLTVGEPLVTPWGVYRAEWVQKAPLPCPVHEAYVDGDRLTGGLTLRHARPGERFTPLGMQGSKLLSDYYTDRKMGRSARQTPILADESGPVFLPGGTVADRVKIQDDTKRILHIIFAKGAEDHEKLGH
jgi:tRNA(Ile)-lysidine synthase